MDYPEIPGYKIQRRLGKGGMASVFLAVQENFQRLVALKVMAQHLAPDPSFGARFMREARIVAQMSHRNFVPVFEVGQHGDLHYMSMEYLPNGDLRELLERGLPLVDALNIVRDIASGLHYAASKNFVHRDIKPENILFREDHSAVITDFGIARDNDSVTQMTMIGTIMGTPHYMSPEQAKAEDIDGRSDLYNLGVIVYEILAGEVPYDANSAIATTIKHVSDPIPLLPPRLACFQPFIDKAMAKEPENRFQTGEELIAALDTLEEFEYQLIEGSQARSRKDREETPAAPRDKLATMVLTDEDGPTRRVGTPVPRRRRRNTTGAMRADPSDTERRPERRPASESPVSGAVAAVIIATVLAGAGGYYWYTNMRTPGSTATRDDAAPAALIAAKPAVITEPAGATESGLPETPKAAEVAPQPAAPGGEPDLSGELAALFLRAEADIEAYRLTSPAGNNAVAKYRQALELDPGNEEALAGLDSVATRYMQMAETSIGGGRLDEAAVYLKQAGQLAADTPEYQAAIAALALAQAVAAEDAEAEQVVAETTAKPAPAAPRQSAAKPGPDASREDEPSSSMAPLPPQSTTELLAMASNLGGPDEVDSGTFRKLAQIYLAVLAAEPDNPEARQGLANASRYAGDFVENSLRLRQLQLARTQIGYFEEIDPDNARIAELRLALAEAEAHQARVSRMQDSAENDLIALMEQDSASDLLLAAEATLSLPFPRGDNPEEYRVFGEQLRAAQGKIAAATELDPNNPGIAIVTARLSRRYAEATRALIELGDLQSASALLEEANSLGVTSADLTELNALLESMSNATPVAEDKNLIEQIY